MYRKPVRVERRSLDKMPFLVYVLAISTISAYLSQAAAEKWVKSNPQGSFAMGFEEGFINNGEYQIVVPKGSDDVKRDVLIKGPGVKDSVDMIFNTNTMIFSNWDGWFKLDKVVYTDTPGVLYFMRSDERCDKKMYEKQGDDIRAISRDEVESTVCQALKAKVDAKMNHFLKFPFKYMLSNPDLSLKVAKGFPGGEYITDVVSGNVYACQYTVEIPPGDTDEDKEVQISAPGVSTAVTMKVDTYTQIYGKWDGTFFMGDKVYTDEPRVLYIDDNKGGCLKKVFNDHGTTISVAYEKILQANECFMIKSKVFNDLQKLIADPKLLAEDEKPKTLPQHPPPITVTSTVVFPKQNQDNPSQSTHTVTVTPGVPASPGNIGNTANIGDTQINAPSQSSVGKKALIIQGSPAFQGQPENSASSQLMSSNVHIHTVTSNHPAYPSVRSTSVAQTQIPQQPQAIISQQTQPISQPGVFVLDQSQLAQISPQGISIMKQNSAAPTQELILNPGGGVQVVVPQGSNIAGNNLVVQPGNTFESNSQFNFGQQRNTPNDLNVHSNNVNIQPDGTYKLDSNSVILQGLPPNTNLVTPDGNVIRVARSVSQQEHNPATFQTFTLQNQGNFPPVVTLSGSSQSPTGNVQTVLTVPPVQSGAPIQHTTTVKVQGDAQTPKMYVSTNPTGSQSQFAVNTNVVVKNDEQQPNKLYFLRPQSSINNHNSETAANSNSPLLLKLVQPTPSTPTVLTLQSTNAQNLNQNQIQNGNINSQNVIFTTSSQGNMMSVNKDKPVVISLQTPGNTGEVQSSSNVHLNLGDSGRSVLITTQDTNQGVSNTGQSSITKYVQKGADGKGSSIFNLMRDLNLPSPVNNLIVNIAESTNFGNKKK